MKMFKYRRIDQYIKENILNSKFVYSRVESFNDPFEVSPRYELVMDNYYKKYFSRNPNQLKKLQEKFTNQNIMSETHKRLFVASFTKKYNDILMWSYYADSHKGICFEFDIPDEKLSEYEIYEVRYNNNRVTAKIKLVKKFAQCEQDLNRVDITIGDFKPLFFLKSKLWEHEEEVRLIHKDKELQYATSQHAILSLPYLTHVYLGTNVSEEDQMLVLSLTKQVGVKVSKMVVDQQEFKLNSVAIPPNNNK